MPPTVLLPQEGLRDALAGLECAPTTAGLVVALRSLLDAGLGSLPLPGSGRTLDRWRALAAVAAHDVALVKLVEGHTDAVAILAELDGPAPGDGTTWGTWAAEPPEAQVLATRAGAGRELRLSGRKAWCSGAEALDAALMTVRGPAGERWLAAVPLRQPGVRPVAGSWHAVGMAATGSVVVVLDDAGATLVGDDGDYLRRSGFWQGGAGIAACWYGGATGVAAAMLTARRGDPHAAAHLGAADTALAACAALLRATASAIDDAPAADCRLAVARVRAAAETTVTTVLAATGRGLGAAPLCLDEAHARRVADLGVFVRQSHAERDLASLAGLLQDESGWAL